MAEFIFFMTYNDKTVSSAMEVFQEVRETELKNIGFKDVGLTMGKLKNLKHAIDEAGMTSFLEVVSEDRESTLNSARYAIELDVDYLIGGYGKYAEEVAEIIEGTNIKFFPYVGKVSGIPGKLRGSIEEIVEEAKEKEKMGVDGLDLLVYRYTGNSEKLMNSVIDNVSIPVIVAGSIDGPKRIKTVERAGADMFTIGTAVFDKEIISSDDLTDQIEGVLGLT